MAEVIAAALIALAVGALLGWLFASRRGAALAGDLAVATARSADFDIVRQARDAVERERNDALQALAGLRAAASGHADTLAELRASYERLAAEHRALARDHADHAARAEEREAAHRLTLEQLGETRDAMKTQFDAAAAAALEAAHRRFLEQAQQRFGEAEKAQGARLSALLQPVESTLKRYEENLGRIEKEREGSYRELSQAVLHLGQSNAGVLRETQRLANVMRSSPKARGRWGEEQLRTILESAGLAENVDFTQQTSVREDDRQLRPDFIVNLPGERCIVIDVKCPLVHFEAAFDEEDEVRRADLLLQHANALKAYARDLGSKAYWRQFERSPDFVILFVPGEHFLSAAAERAPDLIEEAFRNGIIVASTINMLALAKIMAGMWRQEHVREQAKDIADVGRELFERLSKLSEHVADVGRNLGLASKAYNNMVGSLERNVYTSARRLERLGVDKGGKAIKSAGTVDEDIKALTKLAAEGG